MRMARQLQLMGIALVGVAALAWPLPASAQSCALCYTQAASAAARFIEALRSGILVLMAPPAAMSVGFTILAYRKRDQFKGTSDSSEWDLNSQE